MQDPYGRGADVLLTGRGDAAAATWSFRGGDGDADIRWTPARASGNQWGAITRETFLDEVAAASGLGPSDALVVWDEAVNGLLVPLVPLYFPAGSKPPLGTSDETISREPGDVRAGDILAITGHDYFWPACTALAITSLARDPSTCFSSTAYLSFCSFEQFVVRQNGYVFAGESVVWSAAIAVLDDLGTRRDGEANAEPGKARVREAVASLLIPSRIRPLVAGATVEYAEGDANLPRDDDDISWSRATIVSRDVHSAVIRMETNAEEKSVYLGSLRLVEDEPSAAAILLAHAAADHRYDIMQQVLASDVMGNSPLSFTVGEPGKPISLQTNARATALDHAIVSKNVVGIGLLSAAYSCRADIPQTRRGAAAAGTWIVRGDASRRRRGWDVDSPCVAAPPRLGRG